MWKGGEHTGSKPGNYINTNRNSGVMVFVQNTNWHFVVGVVTSSFREYVRHLLEKVEGLRRMRRI